MDETGDLDRQLPTTKTIDMNSYPAAARDLRPVRWGSLSGPSAVRPVISWFDRDPPAAIKTQSSSHGGRDLPLISGRFRLSAVLAAAALTIPPGLVAAPAQAASSYVSWTTAKVVRWVDGDTVVTSKGTVRLIGVDTPERGRCGRVTPPPTRRGWPPPGPPSSWATRRVSGTATGTTASCATSTGGRTDLATRQIIKGAKARYDGRDGYQWHPRQSKYRATDRRYRNYTSTTSGTTTSSWATRANNPITSTNPHLDCGDIPTAYKPIRITGTDYHRLDADSDGWGCES